MTQPSDTLDIDARLDELDDGTVTKAHSGLCVRLGLTGAEVHAHHALARQMALRGLAAGCSEELRKVRVAIDFEIIDVDAAAVLKNAGVMDADLGAAIEQFAKDTGDTEVGLYTTLSTDGYEVTVKAVEPDILEKYNQSHDAKGRFGSGGSKGGVATGSIMDKTREYGGLTIRPTGQEPKTGYIVAVQGHNKEIPAKEFFDPVKGPKHIEAYLQAQKAEMQAQPGQPGRWLGVWHDKKNDEVVLDVVEQHVNRDSAIAAGRKRNQQAIWDVKNMAEIDTGGTGDRAAKSVRGHDDPGAGQPHGDDRRGDRGVLPQGVGARGVGDGPAERVEKRTYSRDSHGRFATVGTGGSKQSIASNSHGGEYLHANDHAILQSILPKRVARMEYNDGYDAGHGVKDAAGIEAALGLRHDRMRSDMATLRANPHRDFDTESIAAGVLNDAGYIDGVLGMKRKYKRTLFGTTGYGVAMGTMGRIPEAFGKAADPIADFESREVFKFNANHDAKGRFGTGGARGARGVHPGLSAGDVPSIKKKPDIIVVTDAFGDEIRLTKADSMWHHMEQKSDGTFGLTAEREAFHKSVVEDAVTGVPRSSSPTMYMLGGGPAAGKTTMLEKGGLAVPTTGENGSKRMAVLVNADEVKVRMPEYGNGGGGAAGFVHEESSWIAKRIQGVAIAGQRDIVLDGTGDSKPQKLAAKIQQARDAGYRVEGHYATVPTDMAVQRAHDRGVRTGRVVPESVVRGTHADVSRTFPVAHHLFDSVSVYDTKDGARRIAEGTLGSALTVLDPSAYAAFIAKGQE